MKVIVAISVLGASLVTAAFRPRGASSPDEVCHDQCTSTFQSLYSRQQPAVSVSTDINPVAVDFDIVSTSSYLCVDSCSNTTQIAQQDSPDTEEAFTGQLGSDFIALGVEPVPKSHIYNGWDLNNCIGVCAQNYTIDSAKLSDQSELMNIEPFESIT
jgi:hypothetical protein